MDVSDPLYYRSHIFVCNNVRAPGHPRGCCAEKGSEKLRNYMKSRVKQLDLPATRVNVSGCLDRCELGPCMVIYPEGVWYRFDGEEDIDEILDAHLIGGKRVERLLLPLEEVPSKG